MEGDNVVNGDKAMVTFIMTGIISAAMISRNGVTETTLDEAFDFVGKLLQRVEDEAARGE